MKNNNYKKILYKNTKVKMIIIRKDTIVTQDNYIIKLENNLIPSESVFHSNQMLPVYRYDNNVLCHYGK